MKLTELRENADSLKLIAGRMKGVHPQDVNGESAYIIKQDWWEAVATALDDIGNELSQEVDKFLEGKELRMGGE